MGIEEGGVGIKLVCYVWYFVNLDFLGGGRVREEVNFRGVGLD